MNNFNRPYRITYISINSNFEINNYNDIYSKIISNNWHNGINDMEYEQKHDDREREEDIYKSNPNNGYLLYSYIFIGGIDDEEDNLRIKKLLNDIEQLNDYLDDNNMNILDQFFNYTCKNMWGEISNRYTKIKFIYSSINNDDTISYIKKKIITSLSIINPDGIHFHPDTIYLTTLLDNSNFYENVNNNAVAINDDNKKDAIKIVIQNIFSRIFKKTGKINIENIVIELKSIGFNELDSKKFIESIGSIENFTYDKIIQNNIIKNYILYNILNISLTHNYFKGNTQINIKNLPFLYLDSNFNDLQDLSNNKGIQLDESNINKVLNHFGNINNNEIYLYSFHNIHNYVTSINLYNLQNNNIKKKYINNFIRLFFPKIKIDTYENFINIRQNQGFNEELQKYTISINNKDNIQLLLNNKNIDTNIEKIDTYNLKTTIEYKLNLPYIIDLIGIFNEFSLDLEFPFVKFKNNITKEILYKIYKNITNRQNKQYIDIISKEKLIEWIKINNYDINNGDINLIKSLPNNLHYKVKIKDIQSGEIHYNGKVHRKYNNSIDILYNNKIYPNVSEDLFHSNKKKIKELKIDDEIEFYKYETIYGDLEINKFGVIFLNVIWKEKNSNILFEKLNIFINKIKNISTMKRNNNMILDSKDITYFNNIFFKTKFLYNVDILKVDINKNYNFEYDKLMQLTNIFYPYVIFVNEIYYSNQEVEYYDNGKWNESTIMKLLNNGNYNISVNYENVIKIFQNVKSRLIRNKNNVNNRKYIQLKYRRISDFNDLPPIKQQIHKLKQQNYNKSEILNDIIKNFEISIDTAKEIINTEFDENFNENILKLQTGIDIKINYLDFEEKQENKTFNIFIEGTTNKLELENITYFLKKFIKLYLYLYQGENKNYKIFQEKYSELFNISNVDINELDDTICNDIDEDIEKDIKTISNSDNDFDFEDDWDVESDVEIDEIDEIEEIRKNEEIEKPINDLNKPKISDIELIQINYKKANPILKRLYEKDSQLFLGTKDKYAKICQGLRQPKLLTNEQKDYVDKNYPNSYKEEPTDIDCSKEEYDANPSKFEKTNGPLKCGSIKWGSSDENQNWYICPKIWDLIDNVSLSVKDLNYEGLGTLLGEEEGIKKFGDNYGNKPFISGKKNWRKDKDGWDITEYNPTYRGRGVLENSKNISHRYSLLLEDSGKAQSTNKNYYYPGLLKSKNSEIRNAPCCFQNSSKNVKDVFNIYYNKNKIKTKTKIQNNYITGEAQILEINRLGLIPKLLYPIFDLDEETCISGFIDKNINCFLRYGINQGNNSFLSLMSKFKENGLNESGIIDNIVKNITIEKFKLLNKGNLEIKFRNNFINISAFQNFIEYTISDQYKKYEFYYDYLTQKHDWLFPEGLYLIIFEIINDKVYIKSPTNFTDIPKNDKYENIAFAIKKGNQFEPIFLFNKQKKTRIFNIKEYEPSSIIQTLYNFFKNKIINYIPKLDAKNISQIELPTQEDLQHIIDKKNNTKFLVDDYNKIVGYLLEEGHILYVKPFKNNFEEDEIVYINELDKLLLLISPYEMFNKINKINEEIPNNKYNIIRKIVNEKDEVVGLELDNKSIIPTKPEKDEKVENYEYNKLKKFRGYNNINIKIAEYRNFFNKDEFFEILPLNDVIKELKDIQKLYETDEYEITKLYIYQDNVKGIILKNNILIKVQEVSLDDIDEDLKELEKLSNIDPYNYDDNQQSYFDIINKYDKLLKFSNYRLPVSPIRIIMNEDKKVTGILLEQGIIIKLDENKQFDILDKDQNEFKIHKIQNNNFDNKIAKLKPKVYESEYLDERIKTIKKIKYKKSIYDLIKFKISNLLQLPINNDLRLYLKTIIETNYSSYIKKNKIKYILFYLIDSIAQDKNISTEQFNKIDIDDIEKCFKNTHKCKNMCSKEKMEKNPETQKSIFDKLWIDYFIDKKEIYDDDIKLKEYLRKNNIEITDIKNNKEAFLENEYKDALENKEKYIEIFKDIDENVSKINRIIDNVDINKCKIIVYNINENNTNTLETFKNLLLNELIRNKYVQYSIIDNIVYSEKYNYKLDNEIIFTQDDFIASELSRIYYESENTYYNDINIYDETNPENPVQLKITKCIITNIEPDLDFQIMKKCIITNIEPDLDFQIMKKCIITNIEHDLDFQIMKKCIITNIEHDLDFQIMKKCIITNIEPGLDYQIINKPVKKIKIKVKKQ